MTWRSLSCALPGLLLAGSIPLLAVTLNPLQLHGVLRLNEFQIDDVTPSLNPFDPDTISVDATFTAPDGTTLKIPAFWHQDFTRTLTDDTESLAPSGQPAWRLRFTPTQPGSHTVTVSVTTNGQPTGTTASLAFTVDAEPAPASGFVRLATNGRHFALSNNHQPLILIGKCVCWHGSRGTRDYDDWFAAMAAAGENYARLWMAPWAFGIENPSDPLTRYRLDRAWQLDHVFNLAQQHGIYLMLCFDYHGMFESEPDFWGGNNHWPQNPYNTTRGGPCASQNDFFTDPQAKAIYLKRLRYLVARFGHSPQLMAWQFFNEIDNVYRYLNPQDVADWHAEMGDWLKARDPYRHLVTTSLTGGSERAEIWRLPQMDFATFHSYNLPDPALGLTARIQTFLQRYRKPMMIGEYGVNWRGWNTADDPHLRALRQGLWAGLIGGSVGTSMSWWWESLHRENAYPLYRSITSFLARTRLGHGTWRPVAFQPSPPAPVRVGAAIPGGEPFSVRLNLNTQWGPLLPGEMAVPNADSASEASGAFNSFVHGSAHSELRIPFRFHLWWGHNARLRLRLNSVSEGAVASVRIDGTEVFQQPLPNLDGSWQVNNEYATNLVTEMPAGLHLIEILNNGTDWFYLDWIELENVLPAEYEGGWKPLPITTGLQGDHETLLYVASHRLKFPALATDATLEPIHDASVTLSFWPEGTFHAQWFDPRNGNRIGETESSTRDGLLVLPLPVFSEDLAGRLLRRPTLSVVPAAPGAITINLTDDANLNYQLQRSTNLISWEPAKTPSSPRPPWEMNLDNEQSFFRAVESHP